MWSAKVPRSEIEKSKIKVRYKVRAVGHKNHVVQFDPGLRMRLVIPDGFHCDAAPNILSHVCVEALVGLEVTPLHGSEEENPLRVRGPFVSNMLGTFGRHFAGTQTVL